VHIFLAVPHSVLYYLKTLKEHIRSREYNDNSNTYVEYVVQTVEATGYKWRVVSKKDLLNLNPHDIVQAFEVGRPVTVGVSLQYK
jgi:hypothetical protein